MMEDTKYGLTGSVWTKDATIAQTFLDGLEVCVAYNNWANDVHMQVPWAGVGLSGNGVGGEAAADDPIVWSRFEELTRLGPAPARGTRSPPVRPPPPARTRTSEPCSCLLSQARCPAR